VYWYIRASSTQSQHSPAGWKAASLQATECTGSKLDWKILYCYFIILNLNMGGEIATPTHIAGQAERGSLIWLNRLDCTANLKFLAILSL
jgi:hypothetical protein